MESNDFKSDLFLYSSGGSGFKEMDLSEWIQKGRVKLGRSTDQSIPSRSINFMPSPKSSQVYNHSIGFAVSNTEESKGQSSNTNFVLGLYKTHQKDSDPTLTDESLKAKNNQDDLIVMKSPSKILKVEQKVIIFILTKTLFMLINIIDWG